MTRAATGIEHSLPGARLNKDTVELFARSKVGCTPTLIVGYGGLSGEYYWFGAHGQLQGLGARRPEPNTTFPYQP